MSEEQGKKSETALREEKILEFWKEHEIFERSLEKKSPKGEFVFYDGPPFATGLPHYGHILPGTIKDAIPRYKTMQGYRVRRQWGWDCHGLPIENLIEQELELKTKKEIEEYGIGKFNEKARDSVLRYADDWRKIIPRTGRWVDMKNDYRTMDSSYTESVWWIFKTLYEKELVYEGFKSMHLCPRCETTLSNFEVNQGYKDITDISVTAKFALKDDPGTYFLAWTTTPWTLPGNVALAVGEAIDYVKISITNKETGKTEQFILSKAQLKNIEYEHKIISEHKGSEFVGKSYIPLFDYYTKEELFGRNSNNWKIYSGSFVSTEEGTGIVHVAPAFGDEDMQLGKEHALSLVQHVGTDGKFNKEVVDFSGMKVKPKENPQQADIEIIKHLAHKDLLFSKKKISHTYPHCWRCDTPLLNYAANSWFVNVTKMKEGLLKANKKVSWTPHDMRDGRFGKGLESAPDWAISRSRYWGAPIPVWKNENTSELKIIGSTEDLKKFTRRSGNKYFSMRHGEAECNVKGILNSDMSVKNPLTKKGKEGVRKSAQTLKDKHIDLIIHSPLERTSETAELVSRELGLSNENVIADERLREVMFGEFEGKTVGEYHSFFEYSLERLNKPPEGGESWKDVKRRMGASLYDIERNHKNKNILIISHESPLHMLYASVEGLTEKECEKYVCGEGYQEIKTGEVNEISFVPLPHNDNFELDLHRPYIDNLELVDEDGAELKRINEVFDCWFESGSMPYGQFHHPFENQSMFNPKRGKGFPADFIAESLDQTRGWFYSLLVLSVGLFKKSPYKNVVVSGLIMGEDGQKMSKRLRNYPELTYVLDLYGADALRYYLLASPLTKAENMNFLEKGLKEVHNKVVGRLRNVCAFYELYAGKPLPVIHSQLPITNSNVLDRWIIVRLDELIEKVSLGLEHYELDRATRPIASFIDDLSTWYIRRSRERFKSTNETLRNQAIETTRHVLSVLARVIAPTMPFVAEEIFEKVRSVDDPVSVHLCEWPEVKTKIPVWPNPMALVHRLFGTHKEIGALSQMQKVRDIVSLALEARTEAGIRVRQPLLELKIRDNVAKIHKNQDLIELIKDEVNVKKVIFSRDINDEVFLDTTVTPLLKREGQLRELVRTIQDLRKEEGLEPAQKISLILKTGDLGKSLVQEFENEIKKGTSSEQIELVDSLEGESIAVDDIAFIVKIKTRAS
jgi:isoleucyl-tRNA synthetase